MNQKVPKKSELFDHKKSSRTIFLTVREQLFVEITGKRGFSPHKRNNCRICLVDKFGNYHVLVRLFLSIRDRAQIIDFNVFLSNDSKPSTRIVSRLLSQGMPL